MPAAKALLSKLSHESGLSAILHSSRDTKLSCLSRFVRLFAYGASFLILVHYLSILGFSDARIGLFMTSTLLGDVVVSFLLTLITDQVGRRRILAAGAVLMMMSGAVFALCSNFWFLLLASVVGVISPSGNEIGPFKAVEESILAQLTDKDQRSDIFAWYTLFGTLGAALGTLSCGFMVQILQGRESWTAAGAYRVVFGVYALLGLVKLILTLMLSESVELERPKQVYQEVPIELEDEGLLSDSSDEETLEPRSSKQTTARTSVPPSPPTPPLLSRLRSLLPYISPTSRMILVRLLFLFFLDSFASGLASPSWLTYFFTTVHSLESSALGTLFLVTNLLATLSNLAALPLARRLGPLKTMIFTHLPSAVFLSLVPFPPATTTGTWLAMGFLSLRACTQSMDQAPRQAFLSSAVLPAERTAVLGVVNIAKTLAQAGGIGVSGALAGARLWVVMLAGAGTMKASYDLLMLWMFLGIRDRESDSI
ncbi:uncharacterized protein A1O5_06029 [Cladophialophora psammophila CBS 110553]|uniref:Major facilitator superfamily (MFS) profile domain-containing protein n=1 Tax=Cladophialophora psammophila CBS 110553 TaxID=1182543 RepID=W9X281_9EURO|nr:uncharacterized protein A1O5_06029 [Cladophialophora psammophila CBS 110553]EXJ71036.1 hypothetical protein A1O5_06029 [Cladophialophora psammophila CBS 110553]